MKVICINDADRPELKFGVHYTVVSGRNCSVTGLYCYFCKELSMGYEADRFAPLSSIDETEMIREYNLTPEKLKAHSISWYTERLKTETRIEVRSFLRAELHRLKTKIQ